jgi:hypothetical protein
MLLPSLCASAACTGMNSNVTTLLRHYYYFFTVTVIVIVIIITNTHYSTVVQNNKVIVGSFIFTRLLPDTQIIVNPPQTRYKPPRNSNLSSTVYIFPLVNMVKPWESSRSTFARHLEVQVTYFILHITLRNWFSGKSLRLPYAIQCLTARLGVSVKTRTENQSHYVSSVIVLACTS